MAGLIGLDVILSPRPSVLDHSRTDMPWSLADLDRLSPNDSFAEKYTTEAMRVPLPERSNVWGSGTIRLPAFTVYLRRWVGERGAT